MLCRCCTCCPTASERHAGPLEKDCWQHTEDKAIASEVLSNGRIRAPLSSGYLTASSRLLLLVDGRVPPYHHKFVRGIGSAPVRRDRMIYESSKIGRPLAS